MKKMVEYIGFAVVALLMAAAMFAYLSSNFGWRVDAVVSGSMEPELKVGSLIVARPVAPEAILVGDIITFRPTTADESPITHRVIGIGQSSSLNFHTKGDANNAPDPFTVPAQNLLGKVSFNVPYVGYATGFLKTPLGFLFAIVIPGIVLTIIYVGSVWRELSSRSKSAKEGG